MCTCPSGAHKVERLRSKDVWSGHSPYDSVHVSSVERCTQPGWLSKDGRTSYFVMVWRAHKTVDGLIHGNAPVSIVPRNPDVVEVSLASPVGTCIECLWEISACCLPQMPESINLRSIGLSQGNVAILNPPSPFPPDFRAQTSIRSSHTLLTRMCSFTSRLKDSPDCRLRPACRTHSHVDLAQHW